MRKNLTEIVFILDRSGSMSGLEADTIGGFNSMIEKQKKAEGEALISTVLFDNTSEVIHDRVSVRNIKPMTDEDYTVRGCTALLDAIGGAIHHIGNVHKYAQPGGCGRTAPADQRAAAAMDVCPDGGPGPASRAGGTGKSGCLRGCGAVGAADESP